MELTGQGQPYPPINPVSQNPDVSINQQKSSSGFFSLKKVFLILLVIVIILLVVFTIYNKSIFKLPGRVSGGEISKSPGILRLQDYTSNQKSFIDKSLIQIIFKGNFKEKKGDLTWVLENEGELLTIIHDTNEPIRHYRPVGVSSGPSVSIKPTDLKLGEEIIVVTWVDIISGEMRVERISAVEPSIQSDTNIQDSTTSATP